MKKIALIIFILSFICCRKSQVTPQSHTPKMAGNHTWRSEFNYLSPSYPSKDTTYTYTVDFPIIVINNTTIVLGIIPYNDTLEFAYTDNVKSISFINRKTINYISTYDSLSYNYIENSIYYYQKAFDSRVGDYWYYFENTP